MAEHEIRRYVVLEDDDTRPVPTVDLSPAAILRSVRDRDVRTGAFLHNAAVKLHRHYIAHDPWLRRSTRLPMAGKELEAARQERRAERMSGSAEGLDLKILARRPGQLSLIEASPATGRILSDSGLMVVADVPVSPAVVRPAAVQRPSRRPAGDTAVKVRVRSASTGGLLRGVLVTGRFGRVVIDAARTNARGIASLDGGDARLTRLWVDPTDGHWSWAGAPTIRKPPERHIEVRLEPVVSGHVDALRLRYGDAPLEAGRGVVIGIVDTGVGPHSRLEIAGGRGLDRGPRADPWTSSGSWHGTHVAGIIASNADPPWRGIAPGADVRSYRIYESFEDGSAGDAAVAIDDAVDDGCDIINLSLTSAPMEVLRRRIRRAIEKGVIVVAAAGNDGRQPLAFPASVEGVIAVGAVGRRGTFPPKTSSEAALSDPAGKDPADFVALFSNYVRPGDFVAPGVGTVSTIDANGFGVMDGTSMAAPVVSGLLARTLASSAWARRDRSVQRAEAVLRLAEKRAVTLGFPKELEGRGVLREPRAASGAKSTRRR